MFISSLYNVASNTREWQAGPARNAADMTTGSRLYMDIAVRMVLFFLLMSIVAQVSALQLKFDDPDISGYIDTTLTASAAMRVEDGQAGNASGNRKVFSDAGDVYSTPISALIDFGLKRKNVGLFTRLSYVYDYTIMDEDCHNCFRPTGQGQADGIAGNAQHLAGNKFRMLDAFVYGNWDVGYGASARIGKQVVNWGESNILGGGISQMQNPVDLAKSTTPGTEVRETLMPQESLYVQYGVTPNTSVEAYYVWNWRESVFIAPGTLFSPADIFGAGYNPDLIPGVPRIGSDEPEDGGQWGLAMRTQVYGWSGAELGLFWVRSHAFTPFINVDTSYNVPDSFSPGGITRGGYKWAYGEDQDTYALSVLGPLGVFSVGAEINYRPDLFDTRECPNVFGLTGGVPGCGAGAGDVWTFLGNLTTTKSTTMLGADRYSLVFDWQMQRISGLQNDPMDLRNALGHFQGVSANDGPITDFSWGYSGVASLEYNNLFSNINVTPTIVWIHNVEGYQPGAAGGFVQGQKIINASVEFTYLTQTSVKVGYAAWLGDNGGNYDRDNVSISLKYAF